MIDLRLGLPQGLQFRAWVPHRDLLHAALGREGQRMNVERREYGGEGHERDGMDDVRALHGGHQP